MYACMGIRVLFEGKWNPEMILLNFTGSGGQGRGESMNLSRTS